MKRISDSEWGRIFRSDGSVESAKDKQEFLTALDRMSDTIPEENQFPQAVGRTQVRQLPRKSLFPVDETLDLHLKRKEEALQLVDQFLDRERRAGNRLLCIVTGKGKHAEKQGVLRTAVWNWMLKQDGHRIEWIGRAPRAMGGDGAIIVQLSGGGESAP